MARSLLRFTWAWLFLQRYAIAIVLFGVASGTKAPSSFCLVCLHPVPMWLQGLDSGTKELLVPVCTTRYQVFSVYYQHGALHRSCPLLNVCLSLPDCFLMEHAINGRAMFWTSFFLARFELAVQRFHLSWRSNMLLFCTCTGAKKKVSVFWFLKLSMWSTCLLWNRRGAGPLCHL
jgi:hypothetical protein